MIKVTVIIPTYHREKELTDAIQSILDGTMMPHELIIIDDGDLPAPPLKAECEAKGIRYLYAKKEIPGLTESRNKGVSMTTGDVVIFFDDDVVLFPEYIEATAKAYEEDPEIGGVGGVIEPNEPLGALRSFRKILEIPLLVSGWKEGKVLPSGFCANFAETPFPIKERVEVDFFPGCCCSYRTEIFKEFSFTPGYRKLACGEDKDFSYRVSKKYKLIVEPKSRLYHLESPNMRPNKQKMGRMFVQGRYLFFKLYVKRGWWMWPFFYYALFGYSMIRVAWFCAKPNKSEWSRLKGIFGATRDIILGRVNLEEA